MISKIGVAYLRTEDEVLIVFFFDEVLSYYVLVANQFHVSKFLLPHSSQRTHCKP